MVTSPKVQRPLAATAVIVGLTIAAGGLSAMAQTGGAAPHPVVAVSLPPTEAADAKIVQAALNDLGRGFAGLAPHLPALRAVLDRAPASYPRTVMIDGVRIIRSDDPRQALALTIAFSIEDAQSKSKGGRSQDTLNVYPLAAFLIAASAVENGRLMEALPIIDKGLVLQPSHPLLNAEKATILVNLKRPAEALAAAETGLTAGVEGGPFVGRLVRARGVALIDLNRLDEAEAAFRKSLEIEPGNASADHELRYIAQLRKGGPVQAVKPVSGLEQEARKK